MARDSSLEDTMERIVRQEQTIAHLAATGRSTALAEKRLASRRRSLDAMLQRRQARAEGQGDATPITTPDQLGLAERDGQPGAEAP